MINLSPEEEKLAQEFIHKHSKCSIEDYYAKLEDEYKYTGFKRFWRKLLGKSLLKYEPGPYPCHYSYILTPCDGFGIGTSIRCNYCGEEQDITDYGEW